MRFLSISLFQGSITEDKRSAALTLEMKGANNPALGAHLLGNELQFIITNCNLNYFRSDHICFCL